MSATVTGFRTDGRRYRMPWPESYAWCSRNIARRVESRVDTRGDINGWDHRHDTPDVGRWDGWPIPMARLAALRVAQRAVVRQPTLFEDAA